MLRSNKETNKWLDAVDFEFILLDTVVIKTVFSCLYAAFWAGHLMMSLSCMHMH